MSLAPLRVDQTEDYLKRMLDQAGIAPTAPDALTAWKTFKVFSCIPVLCADDGFLFEVLPYPDRDEFSLHFVRQFSLEEKGEYIGMQQLDCTFIYRLDLVLAGLQKVVWTYHFANDTEAFFNAVEALPEFRVPMFEYQPTEMYFGQWEV